MKHISAELTNLPPETPQHRTTVYLAYISVHILEAGRVPTRHGAVCTTAATPDGHSEHGAFSRGEICPEPGSGHGRRAGLSAQLPCISPGSVDSFTRKWLRRNDTVCNVTAMVRFMETLWEAGLEWPLELRTCVRAPRARRRHVALARVARGARTIATNNEAPRRNSNKPPRKASANMK